MTNIADRQRAIEREAFPAFHDAKVKAHTDELAAFMTETLITVTPGIAEVEAGFRAHQALEAYETAIEAGDQEAAAQTLLAFGTALTEAVPLGGRFAKAGRFAPALDRTRARIGEKVAELLGAGTPPGGPQLAMASPIGPSGVPKQSNLFRSDDVRGASGQRANADDAASVSPAKRRASAGPYIESLETKPTPTTTKRDEFEIAQTGPRNYILKGKQSDPVKKKPLRFEADGLRPNDDGSVTILEAKFISNSERSPFIPSSQIPAFLRIRISDEIDDEFRRMALLIDDPSNPLKDVEVIVNDPNAERFFLDMLKKHKLNGSVVTR